MTLDSPLVTALIGAAALLAGTGMPALIRWAAGRRAASGRIGTSDAVTLWAASEKMRAETTDQLDKVTAQRDRLIDHQSAQIGAALAGLADSLTAILGALTRLERRNGG